MRVIDPINGVVELDPRPRPVGWYLIYEEVGQDGILLFQYKHVSL